MSTIITIPGAKALHVASPGIAPLPLSTGDLSLTLIPANPPSHPSETVTLSIGSSSFPLLPISPLQRVKAKEEHPSYLFTPLAADGGAGIGQVMIQMKSSTNQGDWEATEAMCRKFEEELKKRSLWDEKIHFVNDEYDTAGVPVKGWGDTVAGAVTGGANFIATKIAAIADSHVGSTPPNRNAIPSYDTAGKAAALRNSTAHLAASAHSTGADLGSRVHEAGKEVSAELPQGIQNLAQPTPEHQKSEVRKLADEGWEQVTIAAKGIAGAAGTIGSSLSVNAHRAVEHNFGKETDRVAQDVGDAAANIGSTATSVGTAAKAAVKGTDATGMPK